MAHGMYGIALYCTDTVLLLCWLRSFFTNSPCFPTLLPHFSLKYSAVINLYSVSLLSELPYMILPHKKRQYISFPRNYSQLFCGRKAVLMRLLQSHWLLRHPGVYCSLWREAWAHWCSTMQDMTLGKACASLYHLKCSVWLIKLIWSVRANQERLQALSSIMLLSLQVLQWLMLVRQDF